MKKILIIIVTIFVMYGCNDCEKQDASYCAVYLINNTVDTLLACCYYSQSNGIFQDPTWIVFQTPDGDKWYPLHAVIKAKWLYRYNNEKI